MNEELTTGPSGDLSESVRKRTVRLFTVEGALLAVVTAFNSNNANLMLTCLDAPDFELGLLATLTSLTGMLTMIPAAICTDRLKNKRKAVVIVLFLNALCFIGAACSPFLRGSVTKALVISAALAGGLTTLYTSVWQAYFADAITPRDMNRAYSGRNLASAFLHTPGMLATGAILSAIAGTAQKIRMHQILFGVCAVFTLLQILALLRITGGTSRYQSGKKLSDIWVAAKDLAGNKRFLFFAAVVTLFYITWRMDGTIFYLTQVKYLGLSEFWLNASNAACLLGQIISIPIWTKVNERMGVRFGIIFGALGLVLSPVCLIVPMLHTGTSRLALHIILRFTVDFSFTTVSINLLQNLLQVIPEKNRTLSIAVYNTLIAVVGSFMPLVGVSVYTSLGSDWEAMKRTLILMGSLRVLSLAGIVFRWYVMRGEKK